MLLARFLKKNNKKWGKVGENPYFWKFLENIMRFIGTTDAKLDAKGRVFLPSDFRKQLAESDATFVLKRDVYQPCLVMYTQQVWEMELAVLQNRLDRWNPKHAMLYRQFMAGTEVVTLDANGRFLLPRKMAEACHINSRTVRFVGVDDRIEVWDVEQFDQCMLNDADLAQLMAQEMGETTLD